MVQKIFELKSLINELEKLEDINDKMCNSIRKHWYFEVESDYGSESNDDRIEITGRLRKFMQTAVKDAISEVETQILEKLK